MLSLFNLLWYYKEQLDLYPRLFQEEIVSLHEKEIVKPETIKELEKTNQTEKLYTIFYIKFI